MLLPAPANRHAAAVAAGALTCTLLFAFAATMPAVAATLNLTGPVGLPVSVNGQSIGLLPLAEPLTLATGGYTVEAELRGYKTFARTVILENDVSHVTIHVRLDKLSRGTAVRSNILFAGLGQHYMGSRMRGYLYNLAEAGGLLVALAGELQRSNYRKDYLLLQDQYNHTINGDDALALKAAADQAYDDMLAAEDMRDNGLLIAVSAIGVSILDALILFPGVSAGAGPVPPVSDHGALDGLPAANPLTTFHAGIRLTF